MYDERFRGYGMNKARAMTSNRRCPHMDIRCREINFRILALQQSTYVRWRIGIAQSHLPYLSMVSSWSIEPVSFCFMVTFLQKVSALGEHFLFPFPPCQVAHLLCLASGNPSTDTMPAVRSAEFVVLRKGFVFARPHERSPGWEETYGSHGDPFRRYQVLSELITGLSLIWGPCA